MGGLAGLVKGPLEATRSFMGRLIGHLRTGSRAMFLLALQKRRPHGAHGHSSTHTLRLKIAQTPYQYGVRAQTLNYESLEP